jgi:hypothetical protein
MSSRFVSGDESLAQTAPVPHIDPATATVSASPVAEAWCPVCEVERTGAYCPSCGHAYQDERLTLSRLAMRGFRRVFDLEGGLLHTFVSLFRDPGAVARDYVRGIRSPYINPFTYFLLAAAVQLIFQRITRDAMVGVMANAYAAMPETMSVYKVMLGDDWLNRYVDIMINFTNSAYTWLCFVAFVLPLAILLRIFFGRKRINLAEAGVLSTYASGHLLLLTAPVSFIVIVTENLTLHTAIVIPLMVGWAVYSILCYFGWNGRTFALGTLSVILSITAFLTAMAAGMLIALILEVGPEQFVEAFQTTAEAR